MYPPESTPANKLTLWPEDTISAFIEISGLCNLDENHCNSFEITYCYCDTDQ